MVTAYSDYSYSDQLLIKKLWDRIIPIQHLCCLNKSPIENKQSAYSIHFGSLHTWQHMEKHLKPRKSIFVLYSHDKWLLLREHWNHDGDRKSFSLNDKRSLPKLMTMGDLSKFHCFHRFKNVHTAFETAVLYFETVIKICIFIFM